MSCWRPRENMEPATKLKLLEDAAPLAKDDEIKARIADDLKRVRAFGKPVTLSGAGLRGAPVSAADFRGKPVLVVFFAAFSPPATTALEAVKRAVADLPRGSVQLLGVSLDDKREDAIEVVKEHGPALPVIWDGKGWESATVRGLGINTLPTVWLLDKQGRLRSLNALEGTASQVGQLLRE
jgi:peroxiredoxin